MYIVFGIMRDLEVIRSIWRLWVLFMQMLSTVSYKGLEHPWVLVPEGALGPAPCGYDCVYVSVYIHMHIYNTFSVCILFMKHLKELKCYFW